MKAILYKSFKHFMSRQVTLWFPPGLLRDSDWAAGCAGDIKGAFLESMLQVRYVKQICQSNRTAVLTHLYSCTGNSIHIVKDLC